MDLGATINIITLETCGLLRITRFKLTPTMMHLVVKYVVKLEGTTYGIIIFVDSSKYLVDFLVLDLKISLRDIL